MAESQVVTGSGAQPTAWAVAGLSLLGGGLALGYQGPGVNLTLLPWLVLPLGLALLVATPGLLAAGAWWRRHAVLAVGLAVWVLALVLGVLTSVSPEHSRHGAFALAAAPVGLLLGVWLAGRGIRPLWIVLAIAGVAALSGVLDMLQTGERARGLLNDPNNLAALGNLALLPLAAWLLQGAGTQPPRASTWAGWLLLAVLMLALGLSLSRAGQALWLGALALLLLAAWRSRVPRWALAALGVMALGALLLGLFGGGADRYASTLSEPRNLGARSAMWAAALTLWAEAPLTGTGITSFRLLYPAVRSGADGGSAGNYAHNDWLQFLQEGGPLLLLPALLLLAWGVWCGGRALLVSLRDGRRDALPRLGLALGLGAVLAHALVNFTLYPPVLGLCLGLVAAGLMRPMSMAAGRAWTALPLAALLLVGLWGLVLDGIAAGALQGQPAGPTTALAQRLAGDQASLVRWLHRQAPQRAVPWDARARLLAAGQPDPFSGQPASAVGVAAAWAAAAERDPLNPDLRIDQALWWRAQGETATALAHLQAALAIDPTHPRALLALARTHDRAGDPAAALQVLLERWLPWAPLHQLMAPPLVALGVSEVSRLAALTGQGPDPAQQALLQARAMALGYPDWRQVVPPGA